MIAEECKNIDKMTKSEMHIELEHLRLEYDRMALMQDIMVMVSRMPTSMNLRKIKDYVEKVYEKDAVKHFVFLHGVRDNIVDMANNLVELQNVDELQYFNAFMYGILLSREPKATEGLRTVTDGMKNMFYEHMQEQESKKGGIA